MARPIPPLSRSSGGGGGVGVVVVVVVVNNSVWTLMFLRDEWRVLKKC
jgi:hypothetical protein